MNDCVVVPEYLNESPLASGREGTEIAAPVGGADADGIGVAVLRTNGVIAAVGVDEAPDVDVADDVGVGVGDAVGGVPPPDDLLPEHPAAIAEINPTNANSARFRGAIGALRLP
jgi:hypothetical protein